MGRGPVVQARKEKGAHEKAKINTLHAKLISIAAERGADVSLNNALADAIHAAKKEGVTTDLIDRAIRRGAGLDKEGARVEEIFYEGYAPGGIALIVHVLSDNRNRSASNIRHIFSAFGGNLGETGAVSKFLFEYKGHIILDLPEDIEALELFLLETHAEDFKRENDCVSVITATDTLKEVTESLIAGGYSIQKSEFFYMPTNYVQVADETSALKLYKILQAFGEDEDVASVWNNADISDELWKCAMEKAETLRFRT